MTRILLIAIMLFASTLAEAQTEMPALPNDAVPYARSLCSDRETGESGECFMFVQPSGDIWMVFTQQGEPVHMRWVPVGEEYITVWQQEEPTY